MNFRLEKGSNDSSRFSGADATVTEVVTVENPPKAAAKGSLDDVDDDGHADAKGSADDAVAAVAAAFVVDEPPRRLNGSLPPKFETAAAVDDPKAVAIGAVKGSSVSWKGSPPEMSKGPP